MGSSLLSTKLRSFFGFGIGLGLREQAVIGVVGLGTLVLFFTKPSLLILFLLHFCAIFCFGRRET